MVDTTRRKNHYMPMPDEFVDALSREGITPEDFTGHFGALLDDNSSDEEKSAAMDFVETVYTMAAAFV